MKTQFRSFSVSSSAFRYPSVRDFLYWEGLDWFRISTHYAVVDPVDPQAVLYLTEREYVQLIRVALSTETTIIVIARPGQEPPRDWDEKKTAELSKISPASPLDLIKPKWWKSAMLRLKGVEESSSMVVITEGNLPLIIRRFAILVASYSGVNFGQSYQTAVLKFISYSLKHLRTRGVDDYIKHLKITKLACESYLAGTKIRPAELGSPMSLSVGGLPLWLPMEMRVAFRKRNLAWIRWTISLLNSYRAMKGTYKDPDFSTIASPPAEVDFQDFFKFINFFIGGMRWEVSKEQLCPKDFPILRTSSGVDAGPSILAAGKAACFWAARSDNPLLDYLETVGDARGLKMFTRILFINLPWLPSRIRRFNVPNRTENFLGTLSLKFEPAGKVRVFAMVDYWTQYALKPLHLALFRILKTLSPMDATFDQEGAVESLKDEGHKEFYSFDLKSATDLIPMEVYRVVFQRLLGNEITNLWVRLLVDRDYALPFRDPKSHQRYTYDNKHYIRYTRGQPMGALSSWASMGLVHHMLVQYAYYKLHISDGFEVFKGYRVLGDDIVIADKAVADSYLEVCDQFKIPVGLAKSIISPPSPHEGRRGWRLFQFASQICLGPMNISPCSLKEELQAHSFASRLELVQRLVRRGWKDPKRNIVMYFLQGLVPLYYLRGVHSLKRGVSPPFMNALLPLLLSPLTKDVGLTGLRKLYAWYQVTLGQYNFANLFNSKFWKSETWIKQQHEFVEFLSEQVAETYNSLLDQQDWKTIDAQIGFPRRFFKKPPQSVTDWWEKLELYFDHPECPKIDRMDICEDWNRPYDLPYVHIAGGPETKLWDWYKHSYDSLLNYTEGKKVHKVWVNALNFPLVAEAVLDYLKFIEEVGAQLFVFPRIKNSITGLGNPLERYVPPGSAFALITEDEHWNRKRDSKPWDGESTLRPDVKPAIYLPNTFERLETLISISKLFKVLDPAIMLRRALSKEGAARYSGYSKPILRLIKNVLTAQNLSHFLSREETFPSVPGVSIGMAKRGNPRWKSCYDSRY